MFQKKNRKVKDYKRFNKGQEEKAAQIVVPNAKSEVRK